MGNQATIRLASRSAQGCGQKISEPPGSPSNNPIKLTVHSVTHLALARCAPVWPAAYRVR